MQGTFQSSHLRIELDASAQAIGERLLVPQKLQQWLWPQRLPAGLPPRLQQGTTFASGLGPLAIQHEVRLARAGGLQLRLSQAIDGYQEWRWGEGWVQSCLEGVSLLPLAALQTYSLLRLRQAAAGH